MKALVWKEWRENRLIVVWAVVFTAIFVVIPVVDAIIQQSRPIGADDFLQFLQFAWLVSALLCGSSLIAPEIGGGSLQFLSSLPVSRKEVWWIKIAAGLGILALSLLASALFLAAFESFGPAMRLITSEPIFPSNHLTDMLETLGCCIPLFAVGAVLSMLTDGTISALMASLVVSVVVYLLIVWLVTEALMAINGGGIVTFDFGYQLNTLIGAISLTTLGLFALSYRLFVDGETLKTRKRFNILMHYLTPPAVIIGALFLSWGIIRY